MRALVFAALLFATSTTHAQGRRVDGIAAVIGGGANGAGASIVLRSDVELRARMALRGQSPESARVEIPVELLRATLDELIGEVLIAREAERVRVSPPGERDIARERESLVDLAGGPDGLAEVLRIEGADERELAAMAERRAVVNAFLQLNLEGSTVVTDAQLTLAYESGDHPFVGQPLEAIEPDLRAWLARQALERAVGRWVTVLRARTPVHVLARY